MKLRCREKLQKVGTPKHTGVDCFDEACVEHSLVEEDNDSGEDYIAGVKKKFTKKPRAGVEEPQQQEVQKDKSQVSSGGWNTTLKDALVQKPEKKLTHRIHQKRMKEVKTLLETPREEIDPMKLSAAHLRLLQEAREHVNQLLPAKTRHQDAPDGFINEEDAHWSDEERGVQMPDVQEVYVSGNDDDNLGDIFDWY
uniref:Uncharacterized protein n=1 Tax=Setaria italica TaxID=4555 RepID=K3XZG3_SETIT